MKPAPPTFHALTARSNGGRLRVLRTDCHVSSAFDPTTTPQDQHPDLLPFKGVWDTGATGSVIDKRVVDGCGLKPITLAKVQGAYGGVTEREVFLVNIGLPNGVMLPNVSVVIGELAGTDLLIGMDIITLGDFAVTNVGGITVFTFRVPSLHTIDYVQQANNQNASVSRGFGGGNVNPATRQKGKRRR